MSVLTNFYDFSETRKLNTRNDNIAEKAGRKIAAEDVLSGKEPELLKDVLTAMMTILCNMPETSGYIIITPASAVITPAGDAVAVDKAGDKYVNYCSDVPLSTLTAIPQTLYNKHDTVLLNDMTVKGGSLEVLNRDIFVEIRENEIRELDWTEWGVSFPVVQVGFSLMENEAGNVMKAISEIKKRTNTSLMEAWSSGMIDDVFKTKKSEVIATSIVGDERNVFTTAINALIGFPSVDLVDNLDETGVEKSEDEETEKEEIENNKSDETEDLDNKNDIDLYDDDQSTTKKNVTKLREDNKWYVFTSIRIVGFSMFIFLVTVVMILNNLAQKKVRDEEDALNVPFVRDDYTDVPSIITGFIT